MLCSKLHCQTGLYFIPSSYELSWQVRRVGARSPARQPRVAGDNFRPRPPAHPAGSSSISLHVILLHKRFLLLPVSSGCVVNFVERHSFPKARARGDHASRNNIPTTSTLGENSTGKIHLIFKILHRALLHKCFDVTSQAQLSSNCHCQILKAEEVSPDEGVGLQGYLAHKKLLPPRTLQ